LAEILRNLAATA